MRRSRALAVVAAGLGCLLPLALPAPEALAARPRPGDATLTVFAAVSLSDAFKELRQELERRRPGLSVRMSFAGSQQLATQIEQGALADVFASADERWMAHVHERGLLAGEPARFARNRLVVILPRTNPARIRQLQDLARGGVKLLIGADAVPVGRYSRAVIRNLSRDPAFGSEFAQRTLRNVVSEEENVRAVVSKVQLGEADAGFVYHSDVTPAVARFLHVIEIPAEANVVASYPIARLARAPNPGAALAFVELVLSSEGQRILERHGLMPVAPTGP